MTSKEDKSITKKLQIDIPLETFKRFKVACAQNDTSMIGVLLPYIEQWLEKNEPKIWQKK
ncbi:hypothetical protein CB599_11610 [Salmonella enterica subsp. enterica serovar Adjame]|nr:hypothetical protein [Salmonella enterica subsp. enterica serovar Adjame]